MREQTVAMYCLLDDLLLHTRPAGTLPPPSGRRLTDAQVLTTTRWPLAFSAATWSWPNTTGSSTEVRNGWTRAAVSEPNAELARWQRTLYRCRLHGLWGGGPVQRSQRESPANGPPEKQQTSTSPDTKISYTVFRSQLRLANLGSGQSNA